MCCAQTDTTIYIMQNVVATVVDLMKLVYLIIVT